MTKSKKVKMPFPVFTRHPTALERAGYRFYNYLDNSVYPVRPWVFGASLAAVAAYNVKFPSNAILNTLPDVLQNTTANTIAKVSTASLATVLVPVIALRAFLKYFYFTYKGFLFENPKKPSLLTKFWALCRSLLATVPPKLKACEPLLRSPSVPPLEQTINGYLQSVKHLHSSEEYAEIQQKAQEFLQKEGKKLNRYAWFYSLFVDNYISGFWEKYAYLINRSCLLINSSVAHVDLFEDEPATQAVRAAHIAFIEYMSHLAIDRQTYKPLGDGLVCAAHYDKMYAVTRIPGEKIDRLENYGIAKHLIALYAGGFYKVQMCDRNNRIFTVDELTKIFAELLQRKDSRIEGADGHIAALTTDNRTVWAENRKRFFLENEKNKRALKDIESAVFCIILDDDEEYGYVPDKPEVVSRFLRSMLTGNGANRWADKSLNYIIGRNGRCGGTTEHSIADGSEFDHIMENFVVMDTQVLKYKPLEEQLKFEENLDIPASVKSGLILAEQLEFDVNDQLRAEIDRCYATFTKSRSDVDLAGIIFRDWGKGRIKKCGVSPDGFVQMAIQLANYRDQGRFNLTYEPASARFYKFSRTETLRSVTDDSCAFVQAMEDPNSDRETRAKLLRTACETHVQKNRECMVNKGVDRHLFVLYVLSQGLDVSSPFLSHYINQPWFLSTSHVPNVTNSVDEDALLNYSWLGAGFGAVHKGGYGVCYRFAGNHSICAHISSYYSAESTDSTRFRDHLTNAFHEMSALFN